MATPQDLRSSLFPGKVIRIFFSEPTTRRFMEDALEQAGIDTIDGEDIEPHIVPALAAGTYPVLVQSFDEYIFDTIVPENRLRDYLLLRRERPNPRFLASFTRRETHVDILQRLLRLTGSRPCAIMDAPSGRMFYFFAHLGERLVIATLGCVPIPGEVALA